MTTKNCLVFLLCAAALALVLTWDHSTPKAETKPALPLSKAESPVPSQQREDLEKILHRIHALLLSGRPDGLRELKRILSEADPAAVIESILRFLASGGDARTGEGFVIGAGGSLAEAPTLRLFLLNQLGLLGRASAPREVAQNAREILSQPLSADEWAISMRNLAWTDPNAVGFLSGKVTEMLAQEMWRKQPSTGFLEAFDVIVYAKALQAIPQLVELAEDRSAPAGDAAAMTLDRLSRAAPLETMSYLNNNRSLLANLPFLRADYYAKADLRDAAQKQAVEIYLGREEVSVSEKQKFFAALQTPGTFVSDTLLTPAPTPLDGPGRREAARQAAASWLRQGRYPQFRQALLELAASEQP